MSEFNQENLNSLKKLARIKIPADEESEILSHMEKIVGYVNLLSEVDTDNVQIATHVSQNLNVLREDNIGELLPKETFLANAPDQIGGMIRTPPVLKEPE